MLLMSSKQKLFIVTTVPITLKSILNGQPKQLSEMYDIALVSSPDVELSEVEIDEKVDVYTVPMERDISPLKDLVSLFNMTKLLLTQKPDLIHSYTPKAGLITMLAGFIARVPVRIHTFTGLIFPTSKGLTKIILIWVDRLICAAATTVVPEGNGVKCDLINNSITSKPIKVIGHGNISGVDTLHFSKSRVMIEGDDLRKGYMIPEEAFTFCFVGRFTQDKGFNELLGAFKQLPDSAYLILAGKEDTRLPLPGGIAKEIVEHPRIVNIGWVNDVRPILSASNVLVLPSYREGFPNTPLQAGSMCLPSIVSNISGCNEIVTDGYNGWIVEPQSTDSLLNAMRKSMVCENIDELSQNARENIKNKFERKYYFEELKEFYKQQLLRVNK